jgi:ribonuclease P protein component
MSYRLTRNNRINKPADYKDIFNTGQAEKGKYWTVIAKPSDTSVARIGIAISKKYCRLAVNRNRLKRLAREAFRQSKDSLRSLECVILSRRYRQTSNSELSRDLQALLQKFSTS